MEDKNVRQTNNRLGSARLQCGLYHNLAPNARIVALGALLILLQACGGGGGGGGGPSMTECMTGEVRDSGDNECRAPETDAECMELDAMMPVFVGDECRAECGEGQTRNMTTHACETSMPMPVTCTDPTPFSHNGACVATCPPEALIPNNGVCEPATSAAECMGADSTLMFLHSGTCVAECPDEALIPNNGVCEPATSAAECMGADSTLMFLDSGTCVAECPATASVSHNGACMATCPDAASVSHNGACRATCPNTASVSHNSVCMEMCPDAAPMPGTNNVCRLRVAGDCTDPTLPVFVDGTSPCREIRTSADCTGTTPIFVSATSTCRVAADNTECANLDATTPKRNVDGSCEAQVDADCGENQMVVNGACTTPTCPGQVLQDGACVASCDPSRTEIDGVCISPALTREGVIPNVQTHNYNALAAVSGAGTANSGSRALYSGTIFNRVTGLTQGRNLGPNNVTNDEVELTKGAMVDDGLDNLRIRRNRGGMGVRWRVDDAQRVAAPPTGSATTPDRRARPLLDAANDGVRTGGGIGWSYKTIALNAADLLDNIASNGDDAPSGDTNDDELRNFRAVVVEWNDDTSYYMAGGVWAYDIADGARTATSEIVGTFADGDLTNISIDTDLLPHDAPDATYTGHSFGVYATLPAAEGEGNRGFFAAEVVIDATFSGRSSAPEAAISGTIRNFLFSGRGTDADKLGFRDAGQSSLENALMVNVDLENDAHSNPAIRSEITAGTAILNSDGTIVQLRGHWSGSFFGSGSGTGSNAMAPPGYGGTWAASGQTGTTNAQTNVFTPTAPEADGGFGISFIGSFGAERVIDASSVTFDSTLIDANHDRYFAVADHLPLFVDGANTPMPVSSVTLGSANNGGTPLRTNDRVYLTIDGSANDVTNLMIDVGNDGNDSSNTPDLVPTTPPNNDDTATLTDGEDATDRRTLGTDLGAGGAGDPEWNYTTRTASKGTTSAGDFEVTFVDWTDVAGTDNNYMAGGVWSRVTADGVEVGAFVDGEDPTGDLEIDAASATTATYYGHAYGRYSLNNGITGDADNPGFFAAKATLNANFGALTNDDGTISGRIHNFLFSTANTFVATTEESALEDAIGGPDRFVVTLRRAEIDGHSFNGMTRSSYILLPGVDGADGEFLIPTGQWGGRFYGTPTSPNAPPVVGGVFSVADATGTAADDVSFSIIGSFGAKR